MGRNFEGGGTGRYYEAKFMGTTTVSDEFLRAVAELPRLSRDEYKKKLFDLYTQHYNGDPTNPSAGPLKDLRLEIMAALGLREEDDKDLTAYSAIGTPLDIKFGTDGFIQFKDRMTGKIGRVTLDTTLNQRKLNETENQDDHIYIGELPDAVQDEDAYLRAIGDYGHQIASRLMKLTAPDERRKAA